MASDDWLLAGDRGCVATARIHAAAHELIARDGMDAFSIDTLAKTMNCSRATIYRHAGGKSDILDAVMMRAATQIVGTVRRRVDGLSGTRRTLEAITVAVAEIRADPAGQLLLGSIRGPYGTTALTASPAMKQFAVELSGMADDDPSAQEWIIRIVLSLIFWPGANARSELQMLTRFVAPTMRA